MRKNIKKLFLLSLIFVSLFALVFVAGCENNNTPVVDEFKDQGEVGEFYSFAFDKEVKINLNENKVTFNMPDGSALNGTYEFNSEKKLLKITFEGEKSPINVNYEDNSIKFAYKGTNYTLYRNVKYTVTYNTDGGSTVASVPVQNGSYATKPSTVPTKEGVKFIGWYKDSAFKTEFDFANEMITADTTVYARYATNTAEENEFKVSFVTGVDGVTVEDTLTFHNTLYTLPTVNVEGKTFIGWWYSSYNDSSRLTCQYKPQMVLYQDTILYAVYESNAPAVSIEGDRIAWDNKGVTKSYNVVVKYAEDLTADPILSKRTTATFVDFDLATLPAGHYVVTVQCGDYTGTAYVANKMLDQVSKIVVEGTKITWEKVDEATSYLITITCGNNTHKHTLLDLGDVNEYDFSDCAMKADGITFTITAKADELLSSTSKEVKYFRGLEEVKNIQLAIENDKQIVKWDAVLNATSYKITLTDANGQTYNYAITETSIDVSEFYGKLTVKVTPVAQCYYSTEAKQELDKTMLVAPKNISVNGYDVLWDAVAGAVSYNITIGDKKYTSTTNSYALSATEVDAITEFKIQVQAVAADAKNNSFYSAVASVDKNGVTQISYANGVITWNSVPGFNKYAVKVDDGEVTIVTDAVQLAKSITGGKHTISVTTADKDDKYGQFFSYEVTLYSLKFNTNDGFALEDYYYATGDTIKNLPVASRDGYDFLGWYNVNDKGQNNGVAFSDSKFEYQKDITIIASWTGSKFTATFVTDVYGTSEITTGEAYFGNPFTFPVPVANQSLKAFAGWYTELNGKGDRYTDETGASLNNWRSYNDITLYAGWVDVFTFTLINNETEYSVSKASGISYVSNITIPVKYEDKYVTTIESEGFASCTTLENIYIPQTIKNVEIGADGPTGTGNCFRSCTALKNVFVYDVEGTKEEDIKYYDIDGVLIYKNEYNGIEIKYFPYYTRTGIYTIPSEVTTLPTNVFKSCSKVEEFVIPASVTKIDDSAFYLCSKLTKITFLPAEEGTEEKELVIGAKVFQSNSALVEIDLPARLASFSTDVFTSCSKLTTVNIVGEFPTAKYSSNDGVLLNAEGTEILFCPRGRAGSYKTPIGVTSIAASAFEGCKQLTEINISGQVTNIATLAFNTDTGLTKVNFLGTKDDAPLTICEKAFYGLTNAEFTSITLPANLVKMEQYAFGGCTKLVSATVQCVNEVDFAANAFGTTAAVAVFYITDLYLTKDVKVFDIPGVFGASKLANVVVEDGNVNYASVDGVLYDKDITRVVYYPTEREGSYTLPETVVEIGDRVFEGKTGITTININKNVTRIGVDAFKDCSALTTVTFEEGGTQPLEIGNQAFYSCKVLETITLPTRTKSIGKQAFTYCWGFTSFVIPEGVETVGELAFSYCKNIKTLSIPASMETILETTSTTTGDKDPRIRLFEGCTTLESFVVADANPNYTSIDGILYKNVFNTEKTQVESLILLMCPRGKAGIVELPSNISEFAHHAFYYNDNLTEVKFPNGIDGELKLGAYSFYWCDNLRKVELPDGVTEIPENCFYYDTLLEEAYIPNTVKLIGTKAFYYCNSLTSIDFQEGGDTPLTLDDGTSSSAGSSGETSYYGTFYNCNKIKNVVLPERTIKLGKYVFSSMLSLESVTLPSSLEIIDDRCFYNCTNLKTVNWGEGTSHITTIGQYAFSVCGFSEFIIPEGVQNLGNYSIYHNVNLTKVVIPSTVVSIGTSALSYNNNLVSVTFTDTEENPSQLKTIGDYQFGSSVKSYASKVPSIEIPASVETIGNYFCAYNEYLTSVTFKTREVVYNEGTENEERVQQASLKSIGTYAFKQTGLTEFTFPYTGKNASGKYNEISMGTTTTNNMFEGCKKLTTVSLSLNVFSIDNLFAKCSSIKNVIVADGSDNFSIDETLPIVLNANGTAIKFIFGRVDGVFSIPEGVTEISSYAFQGQTNITKVIIPKTVNKIGDYAFQNCKGLKEVEFNPSCIFSFSDTKNPGLGKYVFANCINLETVTLPNSLTNIPTYFFVNCMSLKNINLPDDLTIIDSYAFANCSSLEEITFPSSLVTLGGSAFIRSGLKTLTYPKSVTSTNTYIFQECANLETVVFEEGVTKVGGAVFKDCKKLKNVTLASTMTYLSANMFNGCGIESIVIPKSIVCIGAATGSASQSSTTFQNCANLKSVVFEAGSACTCIGSSAFENCVSLTSIELPASLQYLNDKAFANTGLVSIVIPAKVTQIGNSTTAITDTTTTRYGVFEDCANLESIDLTGATALTKIQSGAFKNCTKLTSLVVPAKVTQFGNKILFNSGVKTVEIKGVIGTWATYTFSGAKELTTVNITGKTTKFGSYTFANCPKLTTVNFTTPTSFTDLGTYTFQNCTSLEEFTIPAGVTKIGTAVSTACYTFAGCTNLKKVTLPANMTIIGAYVFKDCVSLTEVTIPSKVTILGNYAFSGCTNLKNITLPDTLATLGTYAFMNSGIESIVLPTKITALGTSATAAGGTFQGCANLKSVTIKSTSFTSIGINVFKDCTSLAEFTIPSTCKYIGNYAFSGCTSLKTINCPKTVLTIGIQAFYNSGLETFEVGAGVTAINGGAFNNCNNLTGLTINQGCTAYSIQNGCAVVKNATSEVVSIFNVSGEYTLPEGVKFIRYAFAGCDQVTKLIIPDSYTSLITYQFEGFKGKKVVLGSGITELANYSFSGSGVEEIEGLDHVTSIGTYVFQNCTNLNNVKLSDNLTVLGSYAFLGCSSLTEIDIPGSLECIGTYSATFLTATSATLTNVFKDCTSLTKVTLNEGIKYIAPQAFINTGITSITIPESVIFIGASAFANCNSLENIVINATNMLEVSNTVHKNQFAALPALKSVTIANAEIIPTYCFQNCANLETVNITSNKLTTIMRNAFDGCAKLTQINLPASVVTIGDYSFQNTGLTSFTCPANTYALGAYAFYNCTALTTVVLNEGLFAIGPIPASYGTTSVISLTFAGCVNLENINLPSSLEVIGGQAFQGCTKIKSLVLEDTVLYVGKSCFEGWTSEQTIYVVASIFDVTGNWCETIAAAPVFYWADTNAKFVYEYKAN